MRASLSVIGSVVTIAKSRRRAEKEIELGMGLDEGDAEGPLDLDGACVGVWVGSLLVVGL